MPEQSSTGGFEAFRKRIASTALQTLADHWHAALGNKRMPAWTAIQPSWIAPHLTRVFAFVYDRESGAITRSFAGNQLLSLLDGNIHGTPLEQFQPPRLAMRMHMTVSRVILGPSFYRGTGKLFQQGRNIVEGERIVLPISTDGVNGDGALGVSDYHQPVTESATEPVEVLHDVEEWFPL
jgi:hypothetical protein